MGAMSVVTFGKSISTSREVKVEQVEELEGENTPSFPSCHSPLPAHLLAVQQWFLNREPGLSWRNAAVKVHADGLWSPSGLASDTSLTLEDRWEAESVQDEVERDAAISTAWLQPHRWC